MKYVLVSALDGNYYQFDSPTCRVESIYKVRRHEDARIFDSFLAALQVLRSYYACYYARNTSIMGEVKVQGDYACIMVSYDPGLTEGGVRVYTMRLDEAIIRDTMDT